MPDMLVKLYDLPDPGDLLERLEALGVLVRPAMPHEKHRVVPWVRALFGHGWASECEVAFARLPVSCHIATEKGAVVGFACYEATCKNFFGPTGVAENRRGLGIGKALLLSALGAMRGAGYAYAIVGGVGDTQYYCRTVGATVIEGSSPGIYRDRLGG